MKLAKLSGCVRGVDTHFRQLCSDCWHNSQLSQPSAPGPGPAPVTVTLGTGPSPRRARSDTAPCPGNFASQRLRGETRRHRTERTQLQGYTVLSVSAGDTADQPGPLPSPVPSLRSPHWPVSAPGLAPLCPDHCPGLAWPGSPNSLQSYISDHYGITRHWSFLCLDISI